MLNPVIIWFPTLVIYVFYLVLDFSPLSRGVSLTVIVLFFIYWLWRAKLTWPKKENLFTVLVIMFLLAMQSMVLYPFINQQSVGNQQFLGYGGIGDYFKHSYVVTSLTENGLQAKHPFFPISDFKYYYGYYLTPSLLSTFFKQWQFVILAGYVLLTNAFCYWIVKKIIDQNIVNLKLRWLVYFLSIVGYSFDLLSMIAGKLYLTLPWYEAWKIDLKAGFRVMTTLQSAFWVPQHFLVACLSLYLISSLLRNKSSSIWEIFGIVFFSLLSSVFVSIYLAFALGIVFLFIPRHRKNLLVGGLLALLILVPYIRSMIGNGANLFYFYFIRPYPYLDRTTFLPDSANWFITVFSQTGWLPILTFITLLVIRKKLGLQKTLIASLLLFTFLIVTLFFRSGGYNDFGMRSVIPVQIGLPIILGMAVGQIKLRWFKTVVVGLMLVSALVSSPGIITEPVSAWKFRGLMSADESRLLLHIRDLPHELRLAAVGRDEWIYKIPSMGFKSVLTNNFYDGAPYADPKVNHTTVEVSLNELFIEPSSNIEKKTSQELLRVLSPLPFDQLIVDERIYVKQGKNPWAVIFDHYQVPIESQTGRYRFYDKDDLVSSMASRDIKLGGKFVVQEENNTLAIKKGLWFIKVCNEGKYDHIFLDFEDYYTLLNISLDKQQCAGNYFYNDTDSPLRLSNQNKVKEVEVYPVRLN